MKGLRAGMPVFGVANRKVGTVKVVREACFEVARLLRDGGLICLTLDAIFTIDVRDGVTLICVKDEVERYRCPHHCVGILTGPAR